MGTCDIDGHMIIICCKKLWLRMARTVMQTIERKLWQHLCNKHTNCNTLRHSRTHHGEEVVAKLKEKDFEDKVVLVLDVRAVRLPVIEYLSLNTQSLNTSILPVIQYLIQDLCPVIEYLCLT